MPQPIKWSGSASALDAAASCTEWHTIKGTSSFEQVMDFRLLKANNADFLWRYATVDRFKGLTLFRIDSSREISGYIFTALSCGFEGTGPRAAIDVLVLTGFGTPAQIRPRILRPYQEGESVRCFPE